MEEIKCQVHGIVLEPMKVGVSYGLPFTDKEFNEVRSKLFPNSRQKVLGGCVVGSIGNHTEVMVCHQCREVEDIWREQNNRTR